MHYPVQTLSPIAPTLGKRNAIDTNLGAALEHARRLTALYGIGAAEVAVAWDVFEELLTAKARQAEAETLSPTSGFAGYCSLNPEAPECRVYDL